MKLVVLETFMGQRFVIYRHDDPNKVKEKYNLYLSKIRELNFFEVKELGQEENPIGLNVRAIYGIYVADEEALLGNERRMRFVQNANGIDSEKRPSSV